MACSSFIIACILAVGLQVFFFSPISPEILEFPPPSSSSSQFPPSNSKLQEVTKLGEGFVIKPEDVFVDKNGLLYTATRDGWIKRLHKNGSWENWKWFDSETLLGLTAAEDGSIIVCDPDKGLLKFTDEEVSVLVSHIDGVKIRFADDVIEASDGSLYFSDASAKFGLSDWFLDVLEAKPHGRLLKYDPSLNKTSVLMDNLGFANGVALSPDQDFVIVCETWKFRCLKHWLRGKSRGQTEIFIDNLPFGPDNINLAPDGTFWIALLSMIPPERQFLHRWKVLKHILAAFPGLWMHADGARSRATVANVDAEGKIIKIFDDPTGKVMSFVTSAFEFEGHLYLGSLHNDFVGKLPLETARNNMKLHS